MKLYVYTMQAWDDRCFVHEHVEEDVEVDVDGWKVNKSKYFVDFYPSKGRYSREGFMFKVILASDTPIENKDELLREKLKSYILDCLHKDTERMQAVVRNMDKNMLEV